MRIVFVDTYYPEFLKTIELKPGSTYEESLDDVLALQFGTADFYSREFRRIGWQAFDIIANFPALQKKWAAADNPNATLQAIALEQIRLLKPDVIFIQDLSFFTSYQLESLKNKHLLIAQCSCALPDLDKVRAFQAIFTSFPHYLPVLQSLGVNAIYMPLAFHESALNGHPMTRDIDCLFVGGVGRHWNYGAFVLEAVAAHIPTAQFYGYGFEGLPADNPIRQKYRGEAWGRDMYRLLQRAKIVINRHGEVAEEYANNMRLYEATGCGAALVTDRKVNMRDMFGHSDVVQVVQYDSPEKAVDMIMLLLRNWETWGKYVAAAGQKRTLSTHTYAHRIPQIAEILTGILQAA